ncbi:MAG: TetR/AcrR family transcriptional regulator [Oscillospiraceae bacterium]
MKENNLDKTTFPVSEKVISACKTKKQMKKDAILNAAFELFTTKGVKNTSIDDIVKSAGVAKGTFYLYFSDKYKLVDNLVLSLSSSIIEKTMEKIDEFQKDNTKPIFEDNVIFFIEALIEYMLQNKDIFPIVHKNISRGLYKKAMEENKVILVKNRFIDEFVKLGGSKDDAQKRIYMIVELANSVLYNAIMDSVPYTLDEIKPQLYHTIRMLAKP